MSSILTVSQLNKYVAFKKEELTNTFGQWLAANGLKQVRIAETEK